MSCRDCRMGWTVDTRCYWWGRESLRIPMSRRDCRTVGTVDERQYWWGRNPLRFPCPVGTVGQERQWTKGGIHGAGIP